MQEYGIRLIQIPLFISAPILAIFFLLAMQALLTTNLWISDLVPLFSDCFAKFSGNPH